MLTKTSEQDLKNMGAAPIAVIEFEGVIKYNIEDFLKIRFFSRTLDYIRQDITSYLPRSTN